MVARTLWLWLCVGWLMTWLTEALKNPDPSSMCDLGPCTCTRGLLVCDCSSSVVQEITLRAELMDSFSFSSISVSNCSHVHIKSRALVSLPALQQVSVAKVPNLTLEDEAFSWTTQNIQHNGLLVNITNCTIPEIPSYCFKGSLRDIVLHSVNVLRVRAFAFSSINHVDKIEFKRADLRSLEPQSFKKFSVNFLTFGGSRVALFPTRAIMDVEVRQEVRLDHVRVGRIETSAFKLPEARTFRLVSCAIDHIEHNAFHVHTKGDVSIEDNVFSYLETGSFIGFTVEKRYVQEGGKQDLLFQNNSIENFSSASLTFNTTGFNPRLDRIMIEQTCSCKGAESWTTDLVFFMPDPATHVVAPDVSAVMYCLDPQTTNVNDFQTLHCNVIRFSLLVKVLVIAGVVLVLSSICLAIYCGVKKKGKRYINVPTSPAVLRPADGTKSSHMLVVPDGKTYRETELHVIVEHAAPIIPTDFVKERPEKNGIQ